MLPSQERERDKEERESAMTHESIASITRERERERERRNEKKKKVGEKERWRFCFGLGHSFYLFFLFDEIIFFSFRCSFCKWIHLTCGLLLSFLLVFLFFFEVFSNKDGDFVLV